MTGLTTIANALYVFLISIILTKVVSLIESFISNDVIDQE